MSEFSLLKSFLLPLFCCFVLNATVAQAELSDAEFDDFAHLSLGADVLPYDWWIRLRSARERDISPNRTWPHRLPENLEERASTLYDKTPSKYISGVVGLSVTWSGQEAQNPDALKSDPEYSKTRIGAPAPVRMLPGGIPSIRMLGTTCAGCHTGNLKTPTENHWIPGGQGNLSLDWLLRDMVISTLALTINFENQLTDFLVSFGYDPETARTRAEQFKKRTLRETKLRTKLILAAKKYGFIQTFPGWGFVREEENIANRLKALLRLTLHLPEDADLGLELNQRMEFLGRLASGTPRKTFQDGHWRRFNEVTAGYGRVDAFINAFNRVLREKNEKVSISAPVGFPPIWGIQHKYLLHYTGNTNSVTLRNIGLAVAGGALILDGDHNSTVKLQNLATLERLMYKIDPPDWKEVFAREPLPEFKIHTVRAERGRLLFQKECAGCHSPVRTHAGFIYPLDEYPLFPQNEIGTDPELATQIVKPIRPLTDATSYPAKLYMEKTSAVLKAYFKKYSLNQAQQDDLSFHQYRGEQFFRDVKVDHPESSYISRDLSGIWATAPFLHNNSVPTLWDLLQKAEKRPAVFRIKHREFDPVLVGLKDHEDNLEDCGPWRRSEEYKRDKYQCIDTSVKGSSNQGHEFGTDLSDQEKWDLIEYLKTLKPNRTSRGPASVASSPDSGSSTPFLDEFDDIKLGRIPWVGSWFEKNDFLKHRLLTLKKWVRTNPREMFAELREHRPIAALSKMPIRGFPAENRGLVLLSKHSDIIEVLNNPSVFSVRHNGYKLDPVGGHMLGTDLGPFNSVEKPWLRRMIPHEDYERIRKLIHGFTEESFARVEKEAGDSTLIRMNLVRDLARRVPARLFDEYFGFPGPDMDYLYKWSYWIQRDLFVNPLNQRKIRKRGLQAQYEVLDHIREHIKTVTAGLEKNGMMPIHDTVLERMLLSPEVRSGQISHDRVAINMIGLLGASIETVQMAVIKALEFYLLNPELRKEAEALARNGDLPALQSHIIEALRLRPVGPLLIRYAEKDATIAAGTPRETKIPAGTSVILGIYSAMRDPEAMSDPEEFKPGRAPDHYFTFGYGHHRCAGDRLAEIEVALILSALLQKSELQYSNLDRPGLPFPEERWIEYKRK